MAFINAEIDTPPTPPPLGTNFVTITPPELKEGTLFYTIGNASTQSVNFDLIVFLTQTNDLGNFFQVQKALNDPIKPYRYESGTSMAAPAVSGMLALFQEYLNANFSLRPSPALLKAMLINGARSLSVSSGMPSSRSRSACFSNVNRSQRARNTTPSTKAM